MQMLQMFWSDTNHIYFAHEIPIIICTVTHTPKYLKNMKNWNILCQANYWNKEL